MKAISRRQTLRFLTAGAVIASLPALAPVGALDPLAAPEWWPADLAHRWATYSEETRHRCRTIKYYARMMELFERASPEELRQMLAYMEAYLAEHGGAA
ncbi:hypothetical protein [Aureimonas sp. D3]|uniref:hypothetical protein n=1 Tax=Aureimonas sp. D3 TaxID=1638164 RepID=UPI0007837009|nr:hypothetical protein [Aureimonas sp. D3]